MNSEQQYIDLYRQQRDTLCKHSSAVMNAVRDAAFDAFCRTGFPSQRVERYKYTDIDRLFQPDYGLNLNRLQIPIDPREAFHCGIPNLSTALLFVANDQPMPATLNLPEGVVVCPLSKADAALVAGRYHAQAGRDDDGVTALNTMLAQDGLFIYVPRGVKVEKTLQVVNILRADVDLMVNRRVLIVVEEGAALKLLFCDHAADDRHFLTTQVIEACVGAGASLELYCLEETHHKSTRLSNVYIDQQRDSRVKHNVITLHNGITRNKLDLNLNGPGAECDCAGCVTADKQQHTDNNTLITHHADHCTSHELYKYVVDEQATGAFAGRVLVQPGAQQTTSQMTNQNLCTTKEARMYTQPMLEIYADDVKCAHGSTVGQLNDAALFYMRQRGIPLKEARVLLQNAFLAEVIDRIELIPLRDRLRYLVEKRLRGELNRCNGCKLCQ